MNQITISILVENRAGVLSRVAGLFSRRGYNIESLAVGATEDQTLSRVTIVVGGDEGVAEQVIKQLHKLIDVIKVRQLSPEEQIRRELVLIKVHAGQAERADVMQICGIMGAKICDISASTLTVELSDTPERVELAIDLLRPFSIREVVRTGTVALQAGVQSVSLR